MLQLAASDGIASSFEGQVPDNKLRVFALLNRDQLLVYLSEAQRLDALLVLASIKRKH